MHVAAGHAASGSSVWLLNIVVQWVHLTAVGVWVGGLFWLLLGFRGRDHEERAAAVGVFTRIATVTLVVVLATGLVRGVEEVGSLSALFDTRYGIALLVKIVLVAGLVGLGALNHFFWVPAVRGEGGEAARAPLRPQLARRAGRRPGGPGDDGRPERARAGEDGRRREGRRGGRPVRRLSRPSPAATTPRRSA